MTGKDSIKIFVTYKDRHKIIKSDIIVPIQTGRAIANTIFEGMIGDNTGDNISALNNKYNELTAQYWVWKNYDKIGDPDYVGFMHYRRHLLFNKNKKLPFLKWLPESNWFLFENINDDYLEYLIDEYIQDAIKGYDCIVPKIYDYKNYVHKTIENDYKHLPSQHIEHLYFLIDTIKRFYPDYAQTAEAVKNGHLKYIANMYVMSKKMFNEYCEFLFTIEKHIEQNIDVTNMNSQEMRFLGYLGEILLTIFILQKRKENLYKIKEINAGFINSQLYYQNVDINIGGNMNKTIKPIFPDNYTAIAMSSSDEYAPYLSVCLQSLKEHSSPNHNYDIIIFERDLSAEHKRKLLAQIVQQNISLRFVNLAGALKNKINIPKGVHYKEECVLRLFAPRILGNYKKIIFTDCDLLFREDIQKLYNIDTEGYPIAACIDYVMNAHYNIEWADWRDYCSKTLKLDDIYKYFNTGVMLIDIPKFTQMNLEKICFDILFEGNMRILEQDTLNKVLKSNIKFLDSKWNFESMQKQMYDWGFLEAMQPHIREAYLRDKQFHYILHFASAHKPWFYPNEDFADIWWNYAKRTLFYEECIYQMTQRQIKEEQKLLVDVYNYRKNLFNYLKYKIKSYLTKNKKEHYNQRCKEYRKKVKNVEEFLNK